MQGLDCHNPDIREATFFIFRVWETKRYFLNFGDATIRGRGSVQLSMNAAIREEVRAQTRVLFLAPMLVKYTF